jgi:hypothetical protein
VQWGIVGVAAAYAIVTALIEPVRTYLTTRALGISFWRFVGAFRGIAQATAVMACATFAARAALVTAGVPPAARLVLVIAVGAVVFVAACLWRAPEVTVEIRGALRRRRPAPPARVEMLEAGL